MTISELHPELAGPRRRLDGLAMGSLTAGEAISPSPALWSARSSTTWRTHSRRPSCRLKRPTDGTRAGTTAWGGGDARVGFALRAEPPPNLPWP